MAIEFITILDSTGATKKVAADLFNSDEYAQVFKVGYGADGSFTLVEQAAPLPAAAHAGGAYIDENGVVRTVSRTAFSINTNVTDGVIVAAQGASLRIRVLGVIVQCGATATNFTFNSKGAGAGTAISHVLQNDIFGGFVGPEIRFGWWQTNANEALTGTTTAAGSSINGTVVWVQAT